MKKFLLFFVLALICALPSTAGAVDVADWPAFQAAIDAAFAAGETTLELNLTAPITMGATKTVPLTDPGSADITELKITGETLTAPNSGRHFTITNGTLTFENVTLQGGTNSGGVEVSGGTANFDAGVTLSGNKAADGGAVSVKGGTASFTGTQFNNNTSTGNGGAVSVTGGTATFNGVAFSDNTSTGKGGAVYWGVSTAADFQGTASFTNNKATSGGALALVGSSATFAGNAVFNGNTATTGSGGAVDLPTGASVTFQSGAEFKTNSAKTDGGAIKVDGTAIFEGSASFASNTAVNGGGAHVTGTVKFSKGAKFDSNKATTSGGAIYDSSTAMSFSSAPEFTGNEAAVSGGAIYTADGAKLSFPNGASFENNKATGTSSSGGALYVNSGALSLSNSITIKGNSSNGNGGAVYAKENITVSAANISTNKAKISTNQANGGGAGGALYSDAGNISITDAAFIGNTCSATALTPGGGAVCAAKGNVTVTNSTFKANDATAGNCSGGAVYANGTFSATDSEFSGNKAKGPGGAVRAEGENAGLTNTRFINNTTLEKDGGAVYFKGTTIITASVFESNTARAGNGGAILLDDSEASFTLERSYLKGNTAGSIDGGGQGGAVCLLRCKVVVIEKTTFDHNISFHSTKLQGGAVYMAPTSTTPKSRVENCTFVDNEAQGGTNRGGALALGSGTGNINVISCTFTRNTSKDPDSWGGAIYLDSGNLTLGGSILVGNSANLGKDIHIGGGEITSAGYNLIGGFGKGNTGSDITWNSSNVNGNVETDAPDSAWNFSTFFGAGGALADNSNPDGKIGPNNSTPLPTLKLDDAATPAIDKIPESDPKFPVVDQRGAVRPQPTNGEKDIGAFEVVPRSGVTPGGDDPAQPAYAIASIRISGIPNTLDTIGQTTSLLAVVTYTNGTISTTEKVLWTSSQPGVAWIDRDTGNIYTRSIGATTITATAARDKSKSGTAIVRVSKETGEYINIHRNVWNLLNEYNAGTTTYGSMMTFVDANPALVKASAFQTAFRNAWAANASQVTQVGSSASITFSRNTGSFTAGGFKAQKGGARLAFAGRAKGDLLPMKYTWSFSWDELKSLLGRSVTKAPAASELFKALRVDFAPATGASNWNVIGSGGVSAEDAISRKALVVTETNNGVAVTMTAYLANVNNTAPNGAKLINGLLVVPDGVADANLSGTMWLSQKATSGGGSGSGSSGEGGGGCDLGLGALALALAAAALLKKK